MASFPELLSVNKTVLQAFQRGTNSATLIKKSNANIHIQKICMYITNKKNIKQLLMVATFHDCFHAN